MASAAVSSIPVHEPTLVQASSSFPVPPADKKKHHVQTTLNYHRDNEDGSPPHATYVGKPETYERPTEPVAVTITDISGNELDYTLDKNGFQIYYHESKEKDFLDDEKIKREYYPETEQLLKDA
jgi:hypothetical protein